jgi:hypothetical protein
MCGDLVAVVTVAAVAGEINPWPGVRTEKLQTTDSHR